MTYIDTTLVKPEENFNYLDSTTWYRNAVNNINDNQLSQLIKQNVNISDNAQNRPLSLVNNIKTNKLLYCNMQFI